MSKMKMKIKSEWAMLDVKEGRHELADHFLNNGTQFGPTPPEARIPVVIYGYLTDQVSDDDGISIEFGVDVVNLKVGHVGGSFAETIFEPLENT